MEIVFYIDSILLAGESTLESAFCQKVLGLKEVGDTCRVERIENCFGNVRLTITQEKDDGTS